MDFTEGLLSSVSSMSRKIDFRSTNPCMKAKIVWGNWPPLSVNCYFSTEIVVNFDLMISRADSVSWNPHKSLGVPLQCSAFLTRHEGLLKESNSAHASYLFQQDKMNYDVSYDSGDKSIQCGRLNDVFKLWLMWKQRVKDVRLRY